MISDKQALKCGDQLFSGERTLVMGILNVTPDSFSDGGRFFSINCAISHGQRLIEQGADIIDVGGVSTAPGSKPVNLEDELERVIPVILGLKKVGISNISIDTVRAKVAKESLIAGASWINDQSGGTFDEMMPEVMRSADAVILMHNGSGRNSGVHAGEKFIYRDIMDHLSSFFSAQIDRLSSIGIGVNKIIVDPGIGFGKGLNDSLTIINNMHRLNELGTKSLIGLSRKSFLGKMTGLLHPSDRDFATMGGHAAAILSGANILRTHNAKAAVEFIKVFEGCLKVKTKEVSDEDLHQTWR